MLLTTFLLLAGSASAQVYALDFSEEKFQKPFKKQLFEWNGRMVLLVEVGPDMRFEAGGNPTWDDEDRLEFFVQDQGDPTAIGYVLDEEGRRKTKKKALLISIGEDRVKGLSHFLPQESFLTLKRTAERELAAIDARDTRIKEAKADPALQDALRREQVQALVDYGHWLRRNGYVEAAENLEKPLKKLRKALGNKTGKVAEASYVTTEIEVPEKLAAAAVQVGGPRLTFGMRESDHLRIVHHNGIPDHAVEELLALGERVIEEFLARAVAPSLPEGAEDPLGEGVFLELFLGTGERMHQEKMLGAYYGLEWGPYMGSAEKGRSRGNHFELPDRDLSYWRVDETVDIQGVLLHRLGHALARRVYGVEKDKHDWIEEGLGYHLTLRHLGHANGSCVAFPIKERDFPGQVITESLETRIARLALEKGPQTQNMFGVQLYLFEVPQVAKAWAFLAYLDSATGPAGHVWLRELTPTLKKRNYIEEWYKRTISLFGLPEGNPIQALEAQWGSWMRSRYWLE